MKDVGEALRTIMEHKNTVQWMNNHPHSYLCHAFIMANEEGEGEWLFGFYDTNDQTISSFSMQAGEAVMSPPEEVFAEPGKIVEKLVWSSQLKPFTEALRILDTVATTFYPAEKMAKKICILQTLENRTLWNMTGVTGSLSVINVKIDALSGNVVTHTKQSLMDFRAPEKN